MHLAGIDEAGLGPILGPYCAGMVLFESKQADLYTLLSDIIGRKPGQTEPVVCDSKKLYTPNKGIEQLEKSVMTFYSLLYGPPDNFDNFLSRLTGADPSEMTFIRSIPWYENMKDLSLPLCPENREPNTEFAGKLKEKGVSLKAVKLRFIPARDFNRGLDKTGNKGTLCQSILTPLMKEALCRDDLLLTVDRQGGRRFYGDWLIDLLPGKPLRAEMELAKQSVYQSGEKRIRFLVGGDNLALETALASLFAKYTRECSMIIFNRYWHEKKESLKKTAGYYTDGKRFIRDLKNGGLFPEHQDLLVRKK